MTLTEIIQKFFADKEVSCVIKGDDADFSSLTIDLIQAKIERGEIEILEGNITNNLIAELVGSLDNIRLNQFQAQVLQAIKQSAEEYRQKLVDAPPYKVAGYQVKAQVAGRIVAAVDNDDTPNPEDIDKLSLEAESKGVTEIKLAEAIIKKVKIYEYAALFIDGLEAKAKLAIEQAQSAEDINKILANLKAEADQIFKEIKTR